MRIEPQFGHDPRKTPPAPPAPPAVRRDARGGGHGIRLALVLLIGAALIAACWLTRDASRQEAEAGLTRALVTFGTARALSAGISLVQGTEASIAPVGVGVTIALGQVLRPVADALEQFASLMLAASVAFGAQLLLLEMGAHWALSAAATVLILAWMGCALAQRDAPALLKRLLLVLLVVRFAVPVATYAGEAAYAHFMRARYDSAQAGLTSHRHQMDTVLKDIEQTGAPDDRSVLERARDQLAKLPDFGGILATLKAMTDQVMRRIVDLVVVFLVQTVVIPLLVLWLLVRATALLLSPLPPPPARLPPAPATRRN